MQPVTDYIATLQEPQKSVISDIYEQARQLIPNATEGLSYGMAALMYKNKPVMSVVAFKDHLSYFPYSGQLVSDVADLLTDFEASKGTIRFSVEKPLPKTVIKELITRKLAQIDAKK